MAFATQRLEQVLRWWEDNWFFWNTICQATRGMGRVSQPYCPYSGPARHWQEFRKYLLNLPERKVDFDTDRFLAPEEIQLNPTFHPGPAFVALPLAIADWTHSSRRMFCLSEEVQILLSVTSLEGLKWSDLQWPFSSFVVLPERPLVNSQGRRIDCILFSHDLVESDSIISFRSFTSQFEHSAVSRRLRSQIQEAIKRKRWRVALELANQIPANCPKPWNTCFYLETNNTNLLVTDSVIPHLLGVRRGSPEDWEEMDEVARLVVGLCLYLQSLPTNSPHRSRWQMPPCSSSRDREAITDVAEVCTVTSVYQLTPEERRVCGLDLGDRQHAYHELRAHFRRGHWRRPPGYGHLPTAPKIVWVKPTLVRRDRVPEGGLPGGNETVL